MGLTACLIALALSACGDTQRPVAASPNHEDLIPPAISEWMHKDEWYSFDSPAQDYGLVLCLASMKPRIDQAMMRIARS